MQVFGRIAQFIADSDLGGAPEARQLVSIDADDGSLSGSDRALVAPPGWSDTAVQGLADLLDTPRPQTTEPRKSAKTIGTLTPSCGIGEERALETGMPAVARRLAGSLAWSAARQGAFTTDADADLFADELSASLTGRLVIRRRPPPRGQPR
jgi:ribonucleoside-diphosphate reductase alpha chain